MILKDVFNVKDKLELIFNFMDISFQLLDGPMDSNIANLLKRMNELRNFTIVNLLSIKAIVKVSLTSLELASEKT